MQAVYRKARIFFDSVQYVEFEVVFTQASSINLSLPASLLTFPTSDCDVKGQVAEVRVVRALMKVTSPSLIERTIPASR